ncbi:hypothetical protein V8J88_00545 [Massilia sp. W12]|uniref:hypothetical protein n=1 Tax=Massilia sp. W12 TaxID=3126507 RepID=UPI0030CD62E5
MAGLDYFFFSRQSPWKIYLFGAVIALLLLQRRLDQRAQQRDSQSQCIRCSKFLLPVQAEYIQPIGAARALRICATCLAREKKIKRLVWSGAGIALLASMALMWINGVGLD